MNTEQQFLSNFEFFLKKMASYGKVHIRYTVKKRQQDCVIHIRMYDDTDGSLFKKIQFEPTQSFKIRCETLDFDLHQAIKNWLSTSFAWKNKTPWWWNSLFNAQELVLVQKQLI